MKHIVQGIAEANIGVSSSEISAEVVQYIEAILPLIIRRMSTRVTPSLFDIKSRELKDKRRPKGRREISKEIEQEWDVFGREISWLKRELDGTAAPDQVPTHQSSDGTSMLPSDLDVFDSPTLPVSLGVSPFPTDSDFLSKPADPSPYNSAERTNASLESSRFVLDQTVRKLIVADSAYMHFVKNVEVASRSFALRNEFEWYFRLAFQDDPDEPDWKPFVLKIFARNMDFEQSIESWNNVDSAIRRAVTDLAHTTEERDLNRNFFVEMDIS